ncbi:YagK/YfjJ domain-containing protein [Acinetobacter nosocomialis]|uniref:YagK/YfjJ domain-containing protein n=1 Tax=Acinetobacter nosocomialis TaxID=106654 RepID=UPI00280E66E6|nr:inovirus-type Gp2 protein [Acinetobacter nosocomialis]MDQ9027565.1 inovirus-type Gp2 protein [Acinetobacter nosocomialis]MDQ9044841.1 inovirus-type Gp2 protein [Acinetobacter nosocomialis]MDQ9082261.1 inovirus-type Gp2 protein [Acinetobacter nosocomialis]
MNVSLNQNEINEASLLIEIESFILTTLDATRQPRSFYETFTDLLLDFDQVYNPDFSYTCLIDLFCSLLHDYDLQYETSSSLYNRLKRTTFKDWQAYFNQARADHLNELRQHRHNEKLNAAKLDKRLEEILKNYSAVLVVRVDLAYAVSPDIEQVDNDLETLRRKIKRSEYGDVLLLVWALEHGEKKGYHCHIALIFNERKRTSAWSIAKAVGELWEDVTEDEGSYFNCHDRRYLKQYEEQDTLGVGIIYSEVDYQVRRMRSTLSYLARPEKEQYLRVKTTRRMRTFGMSQR